MSPYSITREDAAKDASCLRDALSVLREVGGGINEDATIRLTALADSIQEQARTVVEPSEWDSLVIAGTNDYPDRVRWQRDADGFWQAEVQGVTSRWGRLQDPEVLRIGVGGAAPPVDADEFMVGAGFAPRTAAELSAASVRAHQEKRGARFCTLTPNCRMADGHTDGCRP